MAMIIVRYINGRERVVQAQSWRQLDSESAPLGAILLSSNKGSGKLYAVKSSIYEVEEIPQEVFEAMAKKRAEDEAKKGMEALRRKPWNRVRRLVGKEPR